MFSAGGQLSGDCTKGTEGAGDGQIWGADFIALVPHRFALKGPWRSFMFSVSPATPATFSSLQESGKSDVPNLPRDRPQSVAGAKHEAISWPYLASAVCVC